MDLPTFNYNLIMDPNDHDVHHSHIPLHADSNSSSDPITLALGEQ